MISEPMVCSVQTLHLSCADINTIPTQTEMSFHITHGTKEFHRVRSQRFLSLLHIRRKLCTYLASRLTLSPNRPKWASTRPTWHRSTIGCVQNGFKPMVHLVQIVHLSYVEINTISKQSPNELALDPRHVGVHRVHPKWFPHLLHVRRKLGTYLASTFTLSPNGPKWASTWSTSSRSIIWCVQNDFRAYGTFGTNHAPILGRD
jgi:hypothetical protein